MMKKYSAYALLFIISFLIFNIYVNADYKATVANSPGASCEYKENSTGYCFYENENLNSINKIYYLDTGDVVNVLTDYEQVMTKDESVCSDYYVYTSYYYHKTAKTYYGYYCNNNLITKALTDDMQTEFSNLGFPESYWEPLAVLKTVHPTWSFVAIDTNIEWDDAVGVESSVGMSLTDSPHEGYRSVLGGAYNYYTDRFKVLEGSNWYAAKKDVVAFYLDPRNFLNDMYIFQFESLKSNETIQTIDGVNAILGENEFLKDYANDFIEASSQSGVSSLYLSALALQEVGGGSIAISGEGFTYNSQNSKYYTLRGTYIEGSYYNVYNIGAGTDVSPAQNSVVYARGGASGLETSYGRPWNTMSKAIIGGADFIGASYISKGQYTIYLKKFNVASEYWDAYSHQYQTNISAASSEGSIIYRTYYSMGILDSPFVFSIPVYKNMPAETKLPNTGNPNNYLKEILINENPIGNFDGGIGEYEIQLKYSDSSVNITATPVNSNATISNLGIKNLEVGENKIEIIVTAQNGDKKTYKLNIVRKERDSLEPTVDEIVSQLGVKSDGQYFSGIELETNLSVIVNKIKSLNNNAEVVITDFNGAIKESGYFATGDEISITSGGETEKYSIVIYGDANGDGKITVLDLLVIQKHILGVSNLTNAKLLSADASKNGVIDVLDLLKVQKHILDVSAIEQ